MDEPLSSLDAKLRNDLRLELKRIQQDLGATMLYVTHDQMEALTMATRIGVLEHGRLVQVGTPQDVYEDPASTYVAARLGSPRINLIARALVPGVGAPGQTATVGVRAEHVRLHVASSGSARPAARVRRMERLGDRQLMHVQLAGSDQELVTAAPGCADFEPGSAVQLELVRPLWFDAAGQRIAA
jgi:multiple sugar transport system ATP-binding protein